MENKVHYKLFKNGKFLCTMALSTVAVLTTFGEIIFDFLFTATRQQSDNRF